MRYFLILIVSLISLNILSQESLKSIEIDSEFTWKNSEYWERDSVYFDLPFVKNSKHKVHFRIYLPRHLIDFFSDDEINYSGIITTRITQLISEKTEWGEILVPKKIFFHQVKIENSLATNLALSIIESGQPLALTEKFLEYWNSNFFHCSSIRFHFKINQYFRPQNYNCPWNQDSAKTEVKTILNVYQNISEKLNLNKRYDELVSELPRGKTYSYDGYRLLYLMTNKELKEWEKGAPKRNYLESIKDTTISYLRNYLSNQPELNINIDCFENFSLTIGKGGHLDNISVFDYDKPKLRDGFKERRRVKNCEKFFSKIFSDIDLSFLELDYSVVRTVSFTHNEKILIQ